MNEIHVFLLFILNTESIFAIVELSFRNRMFFENRKSIYRPCEYQTKNIKQMQVVSRLVVLLYACLIFIFKLLFIGNRCIKL